MRQRGLSNCNSESHASILFSQSVFSSGFYNKATYFHLWGNQEVTFPQNATQQNAGSPDSERFSPCRVAFLPHNGIAHLAPMHKRICRKTATLSLWDKWMLNLEVADMKTSAQWMIYSQYFIQQFGGRWIFDGLFREDSFITLFLRPEQRRDQVMGTDCCKVSSYWGSLARSWSTPMMDEQLEHRRGVRKGKTFSKCLNDEELFEIFVSCLK